MNPRLVGFLVASLAVGCVADCATAQFMYLDSNGDGISSEADVFNQNGTPTPVDVYIFTDLNADYSPAYCNTSDGDLTINSYVVNLGVSGGTVTFTSFVNRRPEMGTILVLEAGDSVETTEWQRGQGGGTINPPTSVEGVPYRLMSITVTGVSGSPALSVRAQPSLGGYSTQRTSFGSLCSGTLGENTYALGVDWTDTGGIAPFLANTPPAISVPDTTSGFEGESININATSTDPDAGQTLTITVEGAPSFLTLVGGTGSSPVMASLVGTPGYADSGSYVVHWTAMDSGSPAQASAVTTWVTIQNVDQPPNLVVPGSVTGSASDPVSFSIATDDPDGDVVTELTALHLPPGASLIPSSTSSEWHLNWTPDATFLGEVEVVFAATSNLKTTEATTRISVDVPSGPSRPRVSPSLLNLQPGRRSTDRMLFSDQSGRLLLRAFLVGTATTEELEARGVTVTSRIGDLMTASCLVDSLQSLFRAPGLRAVLEPGICEPLLDRSAKAAGVSGLRSTPPPTYSGSTGAGVVVGIVDTGIDVKHTDFRKLNGTTRIVSYWDQGPGSGGTPPPSGFSYGAEWSATQINQGLVQGAHDLDGHGTGVAGVAVGNGDGGWPCRDQGLYVGMAPEADICAVKLKSLTVGAPVLGTDVVDAVKYVFQKATSLGKPAVVNLSVGDWAGPHNGRSITDLGVNSLTGPGKIAVAGAGNDALTGRHATALVNTASTTTWTFDVSPYEDPEIDGDVIKFQGWFNVNDRIAIKIISPNNYTLGPLQSIPGGYVPGFADTPDGYISVDIGCCFEPGPDGFGWLPDSEVLIKLGDGSGHEVADGTWTIQLTATAVPQGGRIDMYLTELAFGAETPVVRWILGEDPARTILSPASADSVIAVGAYTTKTCWKTINGVVNCNPTAGTMGDIAPFSSRGPRRDGVRKPDITAPGAVIVTTRSRDMVNPVEFQRVLGDSHYVFQGTSFSAPHVAGAVALLLAQPGWATASPSRVKQRLQTTCRRDSFTGFEVLGNNVWGLGKLDIKAALEPVFAVDVRYPPPGEVFLTSTFDSVVVAISGAQADSVVVSLDWEGCESYATRLGVIPALNPGMRGELVFLVADNLAGSKAKVQCSAYRGGARVAARSDTFTIQLRSVTAVSSAAAAPARFLLAGNAPNPFNPRTLIRYDIARSGPFTLRVYSVDGRLVHTIVREWREPGRYEVAWDGRDTRGASLASGVYLLEGNSCGERLVRKMSLIR